MCTLKVDSTMPCISHDAYTSLFDVNDAGLKATVLCVLAAIACSPRTKTEHGMNHQLERFQNKVEMAKKK